MPIDNADVVPAEQETGKQIQEIVANIARETTVACKAGECSLKAACTQLSDEELLKEFPSHSSNELEYPGYRVTFSCTRRCEDRTRVNIAIDDFRNLIDRSFEAAYPEGKE